MANPEHLSYSACSEDTNSICDEDKIRQLFQVCDNDGDGFIDSRDLAAVCQDLNLEYCLEDLMQELGADQTGKISYHEFLQKRLALKPEIDALRKKACADSLLTSSEMSLGAGSLGKHECWEFDSGARDLSPEPNTLQRLVEAAGGSSLATSSSGNLLQLANKLHLAALSSLRNEILDLNTRLQNVTEQRDVLEKALEKNQNISENSLVQQYEEQITELHSVIAELSRKLGQQKQLVITEEDECTDTQSVVSHTVEADRESEEDVQEADRGEGRREPKEIRQENDLNDANKAVEMTISTCRNCIKQQKEIDTLKTLLEKSQAKLHYFEQDQRKCFQKFSENDEPVMKMAEKVQLKTLVDHITGSDLMVHGISQTKVAEHLVSNLTEECNTQEFCRVDRKYVEIETEKLNAKLEHVKIQNTLLQMTVNDMKSYCERLTVLLGKYESNAIALDLVLDVTDKIIEKFKIIQENRNPDTITEEEMGLLKIIQKLEKERSKIGDTVVKLESYHTIDEPKIQKCSSETRKMDLEMAVLMQELLSMREDKVELRSKIYNLEHDKDVLEMKLNSMECDRWTPSNQETESDELSAEIKLRERLKEMSLTLDRVTRTYELRQIQSSQLINELKASNSTLVNSFEKCKKKSQSRLKRLENEIIIMAERHSAQVQHLKQRIVSLEEQIARNVSKDNCSS